jgi:hypothetical protein
MKTKRKRYKTRRWPQFRSADPFCDKCRFLDPGRAEVMLSMLVLPDILQRSGKAAFIKALHDASEGNPNAFSALLSAVRKWSHWSSPADIAQLDALWAKAKLRPPTADALALLRKVCVRQRFMPPSMIDALFDDASFDFAAYLNWQNGSTESSVDLS